MQVPALGAARLHDGLSAQEQAVTIALSRDRMGLEIRGATTDGASGLSLHWALSDLRALPSPPGAQALILTRHSELGDERPRDPARLVVTDPDWVAWLRHTRPDLGRRDVARGTLKRVALFAGSALGAVLLLLFVLLPAMANTLAQIIPPAREAAFGQTVTQQMERMLGGAERQSLICDAPEGRAALDDLVARLHPDEAATAPLTLVVFDHPMVNAFAAPGGHIVVLRGLIDEAAKLDEGPDALAAVLAHEIGHVVARDPTRLALRAVGSAGLLSIILGDVTGGTAIVFMSEHLLNTSYTREAEFAADAYALATLTRAEISASGMAAFFERMLELQSALRVPEILSTHPDTAARAVGAAKHATQQAQGGGDLTPALSPDAWRAVQSICD